MRRVLIHWILRALAVWLTSLIVHGIYVSHPAAALIAAIAIGLANATIGLFLKIITFPSPSLPLEYFGWSSTG